MISSFPEFMLQQRWIPDRKAHAGRFTGTLLLGMLCVVSGWSSPPASPDSKGKAMDSTATETIWSQEKAYFTHLYGAEHESFMALVHPDFLGWPDGQTGPIDREGSAAFMRKLVTQPLPCRLMIDRLGIRIHGSAAVTHYILHATCTAPDGTSTTRSSRVCHTWIKEGTKWKLLAGTSHDL